MKKMIWIILLSAGASAAHAQQQTTNLNQNKGWWTVESNVKSPKKQLVKFYNSDSQLLYEEIYNQKILNYSRKRIRRMLDSALAAVLKAKTNIGEAANLANVIKHKH
ncbi:MAG: hypothetical protein V5804_08865 [Mucilaginibacter sp.]|uniref:hypothetical protein n=1 Tax=Mucilaginibacter sp. TaxID=1882438 RepID=UPI0034E4F225